MPFSQPQCPTSPQLAPASWSIPTLTLGPNETYVSGSWVSDPLINGSSAGNNVSNVIAGTYNLTFDGVYTDANGINQNQTLTCQVVVEGLEHNGCPDSDVEQGNSVTLTVPNINGATYEHTVNGQIQTNSTPSITISNTETGQVSVTTEVCTEGDVNSTSTTCRECDEPCPCPESVLSAPQLISSTSLHQYSVRPVTNADETLAVLDLTSPPYATSIVYDIENGQNLGWPGVNGAATWSCIDPDIIWGVRNSPSPRFYRRNFTAGTETVVYTPPAGTTLLQMGKGQGVVQRDECVALNEITNGVESVVILDLTTSPATVVHRFTVPDFGNGEFKWVRMSKDCSRFLVLVQNTGSGDGFDPANNQLISYETGDPAIQNGQPINANLGLQLDPTSHADFISMPNGSEWFYSVGGGHFAQNIQTGERVEIGYQSSFGHISGLASCHCPGLVLWSPERYLGNGNLEGGPMTLTQYDDNFNIVWQTQIPFNHGTMGDYPSDPMASISRCGKYIFVRSDNGSAAPDAVREYMITLDNGACPRETAPECVTYTCNYNVVPIIGGGGDCLKAEFEYNADGSITIVNPNSTPITITPVGGSIIAQNTIPANGSITLQSNEYSLDDNSNLCILTACS